MNNRGCNRGCSRGYIRGNSRGSGTAKFFLSVVLLLLGGAIGYSLQNALSQSKSDSTEGSQGADESKPLYWVAPMDPNYKRDKPGKSPMGMDLIPVYEQMGGDEEVGTVTISPDVVNNLGVRTAPVTRGRLDLTISTVGYVQYDEDRLVHIHPRVEGWIEKLHVKAAGDPVIQGEPLYALYSPTLVNAQEELLLALTRNNPTLITAAMERLSALQVPHSEINRLKKSGKVSQTITITAPQSGVLDNLNTREGMFVKPGMEMMAIGQLEHIWVIGEIFERQAASVQVGDAVRMRLDYLPGREWNGNVDYIYPSLNAKTRTAQVRVHFDSSDRFLRPGMFAQMTIVTKPSRETLLIPREALIRTGSQSRVVLAKGEGRFKSIAVKVGRIGEDKVEILSGLKDGERIVSSAQFLIDSESSKTSDFKRMHHGEDQPSSVWVAATIESVMPNHRMVTVKHEAIDAWEWPEMTMDFQVNPKVNFEALTLGTQLHMEITKLDNGQYEMTGTHIMHGESEEDISSEDEEKVDHSQMNHGEMDHSNQQQHSGDGE